MSNTFVWSAVAVGGPAIRWNVSDNMSNTAIFVVLVPVSLSPLAAAAGAPAAWRGSQCSRRSRATGVVLSKLVLDLTWTRPNILSNEIK
jgi:hypothetical protein